MAKETALEYFIGTDHDFEFVILNDAGTQAINISGWPLSFMVKRSLGHLDAAAKVTKATGSGITITGTYDADPALNTQKATVSIADTDTDALPAGEYFYELKRTAVSAEAVLAYGTFTMLRSVHRS